MLLFPCLQLCNTLTGGHHSSGRGLSDADRVSEGGGDEGSSHLVEWRGWREGGGGGGGEVETDEKG